MASHPHSGLDVAALVTACAGAVSVVGNLYLSKRSDDRTTQVTTSLTEEGNRLHEVVKTISGHMTKAQELTGRLIDVLREMAGGNH